jgi:hypothetical protein
MYILVVARYTYQIPQFLLLHSIHKDRTRIVTTPVSDLPLITSLDSVILGGIVIFIPTYYKVFTGKRISRTNLRYEGAIKHQHAQASAKTGQYLISR